jgi:hypothetical protein
MHKQCGVCGLTKSINEFYVSKRNKTGYRGECKQCSLEYHQKHPEVRRRCNLRKIFGITVEEYDAALALQGKKCGCCGISVNDKKPRNFAVDHCHETGALRGILCRDCNLAIGFLGDNLSGIEKAIRYLEKFEQQRVMRPISGVNVSLA